jgi:iron complex outermembrane recepter protein
LPFVFALSGLFGAQAFAQDDPGQRVLEEIIVVAQKREENIQDIPISVTAMSALQIEQSGMQDIVKLTELDPSVYFDTAQSFQRSSLKIRGIGTIGNTRSFEGAVGVFVDGVYRPRSGMALADLLDIDRIEILRGPQGTLFGKNTVAGAIGLRSSRPDPSQATGRGELRLGNFDSRFFTGAFNLPVGDASAVRLAGTYNKRDGSFVSPDNGDTYDAVDRFGLKAQFLIEPSDSLEVLLIADHTESDANCCWGSAQVVNGPTAPLIELYSTLNGLTFPLAPDAERNRSQSLNTSPREKVLDSGITAAVRWDIGGATLKSVTSWREWEHSQINADADFVPADLFQLSEPAQIDTASQELTLTLPLRDTDSLLLGLYLGREEYRSSRSVQTGADADDYLNSLISADLGSVACTPPLTALDCAFPTGISALLDDGEFTTEDYFQDSDSLGIFAHGSFALAPSLRLVAGLRYSLEEKSGGVDNRFWYDSALVRAALESAGVPDDGTPRNGLDLIGTVYSPSFTSSVSDETVTGTLSLQYFQHDTLMYYGGYHRGFKAGGVNLFREGVVSNATSYLPEFADSLEAGVKTTYLDGRAQSNLSVFFTRFTDLQINFFTGLEFRTENTGSAETQGVELENHFQVSDELLIDFSLTYLDARFKKMDDPFLSYLVDRQMPRAPEWAGVLTATYTKPLTGRLDLFIRGMASYTGSHFVGTEVPSEEKVGSFVIVDTSIGITSLEQGWDLLVWCSNCGDQSYRTVYFNTTFQPGSFSAYLNQPRQYGVTLRARF